MLICARAYGGRFEGSHELRLVAELRVPSFTGGMSAAHVTPQGHSKQAQRATELANTVYAGVRHKMAAMKSEMTTLRDESACLRRRLEEAEKEALEAQRKASDECEAKLSAASEAAEVSIQRHLSFIDRLLADKADLSKQCDTLRQQVKLSSRRRTRRRALTPTPTLTLTGQAHRGEVRGERCEARGGVRQGAAQAEGVVGAEREGEAGAVGGGQDQGDQGVDGAWP